MKTSINKLTFRGRYRMIEEIMTGKEGSFLDIGARDKILSRYLDPRKISYQTADVCGEHDHLIDLERPLALADRSFDYVAALDVIEHVNDIHGAIGELLRITGKCAIISLPNMASYANRLRFLFCGRLTTDKYSLPADPVADRHRWLTTYADIIPFMERNAERCGFRVERIVLESEGGRVGRLFSWLLLKCGFPLERLLCARVVAVLSRNTDK